MIKNPIYKPAGRAGEYGDLACNIYAGCSHGCDYCFAPRVLHTTREMFAQVRPRDGILEALKKQLDEENITGKTIHLCFTCDPYPAGVDTQVTRDVIETIKEYGNHVQILTKGGYRAVPDFNLLDGNDWFGITISGFSGNHEPNAAAPYERISTLQTAKRQGIKTWVSCEPVLNTEDIFELIEMYDFIDLYKIGKLNYATSDINWAEFGRKAEWLCKMHSRKYYIKEDLRREMEKGG